MTMSACRSSYVPRPWRHTTKRASLATLVLAANPRYWIGRGARITRAAVRSAHGTSFDAIVSCGLEIDFAEYVGGGKEVE